MPMDGPFANGAHARHLEMFYKETMGIALSYFHKTAAGPMGCLVFGETVCSEIAVDYFRNEESAIFQRVADNCLCGSCGFWGEIVIAAFVGWLISTFLFCRKARNTILYV